MQTKHKRKGDAYGLGDRSRDCAAGNNDHFKKNMNFPAKSFGKLLRERRLACGFGLREFATLVGVSSTYISQLEQENIDPPTAERAAKMAEILGENADQWIALAGRVPDDLEGIIQKQPIVIPALLREANGLTAEQLKELAEHARKMKEDKK